MLIHWNFLGLSCELHGFMSNPQGAPTGMAGGIASAPKLDEATFEKYLIQIQQTPEPNNPDENIYFTTSQPDPNDPLRSITSEIVTTPGDILLTATDTYENMYSSGFISPGGPMGSTPGAYPNAIRNGRWKAAFGMEYNFMSWAKKRSSKDVNKKNESMKARPKGVPGQPSQPGQGKGAKKTAAKKMREAARGRLVPEQQQLIPIPNPINPNTTPVTGAQIPMRAKRVDLSNLFTNR